MSLAGAYETASLHTEREWRRLDARNVALVEVVGPLVGADPERCLNQPTFDEMFELVREDVKP